MTNVLTGMGDPLRDRSMVSTYVREPDIGVTTLDALYEGEGLAARIVDLPADDMVRESFDFEGLEGVDVGDVHSAVEDYQCLEHLANLHRWGNHYGGALLVAAVDDGSPAYEPLQASRVRKVHGFEVLDRHCVEPITDGMRPPEGYRILSGTSTLLEDTVVHASRVRRCAGIEVSPRRKPHHRWWGVPRMQRVWKHLKAMLSAHQYGGSILHDVSVDVFHIVGLVEAFEKGNEELVRARLRSMQLSKSVLNAIALDAGGGADGHTPRPAESYMPQSRSVAGIRDLVELFVAAFVGVAGIPRSQLLGQTPGGMNTGSNSGELRAWYALVSSLQAKFGTRALNWMLELIFADREGPTRGKRPATWSIKWRPLHQMTALEEAEVRLKRLQGDKLLWDMTAAGGEDVRHTRMVQGSTGELIPFTDPDDADGLEDTGLKLDQPEAEDSAEASL